MKILVVNWQDPENPHAGGAELHLREIFSRVVAAGHRVDLLCSGWEEAPSRDEQHGIDIHRVGGRHTFQFVAKRYYDSTLAPDDYAVVVEDINKIPLFTPLWNAKRVVALVHHLFGATAFREALPPIAAAVWLSERPIGRVYRDVPFEAVSESTADDLVARGIPRSAIRVIYNAVDSQRLTPRASERAKSPTFVYLGRLKKYKRVDFVIHAFAEANVSGATLEIAGIGDYRRQLEDLVRSLDLVERVRFLGFIPEEEKVRLLRRAWATALASRKEGWGISNLESAACGTPVIATNSPGIRESLLDGKTGFLVESVGGMAAAMRLLASSPEAVSEMGTAGRRFAEQFSWDRSAAQTIEHLESVIFGGAAR